MTGPRILFVTRNLAARGGVQLHVRDTATALLARGARPVVHATVLGEVAEEIRAAGVPVVASLDELGTAPDLVQGQYHAETMAALLRFPEAPAIFVCHAWGSWWEGPPRHPRIARYVAVDHAVRDRLVMEHGLAESQVVVLLNAVDLRRFRPRPPLPEKPRRALVLSNYADEGSVVAEVRRACAPFGIEVDAIGAAVGRPSRQPERELARCDLVFAKGRSALEALAVGAAVILCDRAGHGPW